MAHQTAPIADVAVLQSTQQAAAALDPLRLRILAHLRHPDSAAGTARALHSPRQRIGYHIRQLSEAGLISPVGERRSGTSVEQLLQSPATHFFLGPLALGPVALDPAMAQDQLSSTYLIASAYRTMLDVSELQHLAKATAKKLPTLTLETEISFESADAQNAFAAELSTVIRTLCARYTASNAPITRKFRMTTSVYPTHSSRSEELTP